MNVLLDTSVWIEYFKGNDNYFAVCQELIERSQAYTIEIIFAELLQGAKGKREIDIINTYYTLLPKINMNQMYMSSAEFSRKEKLLTKGIGLIDACIITAASHAKCKLWTLDKKIISFLDKDQLYSLG